MSNTVSPRTLARIKPDINWWLSLGDCLDLLKYIPDYSIDSIITDPPYPEIDRPYGKLTEEQWHKLMRSVVSECRRVLKPRGSAVFILQANSEHVGRMRPWLWEFLAWTAREWNQIQDCWWWNPSALPTVHCHREIGLMRPSVKACVWLGEENCYRSQDSVLWTQSDSSLAVNREDRALRYTPGNKGTRPGRMAEVADSRGGTTPFNLIPISNTTRSNSGGAFGHGAATPLPLCEWWVRYLTPKNGVVLDPFMGSGTTGLAALKHGCRYLGIEKEPEYFDIALTRLSPTVSPCPA